jgi:hypothetical protein
LASILAFRVTGNKKSGWHDYGRKSKPLCASPFVSFTDVAPLVVTGDAEHLGWCGFVDQLAGRSTQTREQGAWHLENPIVFWTQSALRRIGHLDHAPKV